MNYYIRKYFSGYCTYEVEAENEEVAIEIIKNLPINYEEVASTLEEWEECLEVEPVKYN